MILSATAAGKTYWNGSAAVHALHGVDLDVAAGEFVAIVGPSGCGKSTLLRVVADLVAPTSGRVQVLGTTPEQARRNRAIGFVFQDSALLAWRSAIQNVELPLLLVKMSGKERLERARHALATSSASGTGPGTSPASSRAARSSGWR